MKENQGDDGFSRILLAIIIIMGFTFLVSFFVFYIKETYGISDSCECKVHIDLILIIFSSLGVLIGCITYYLISKHYRQEYKGNLQGIRELLDLVPSDERQILMELIKLKGEAYQSTLVEKTDFTKVKVSRILSGLEQKNIIEKNKEGMTNKILLKKEIKRILSMD